MAPARWAGRGFHQQPLPKLRTVALWLASHADYADDLVQETSMKAWNHQNSFQEGLNIKAWLFTILRNLDDRAAATHLWALFAFILNFIPYLGPISGLALSAVIGIVVFDSPGQALLAPLVYGLADRPRDADRDARSAEPPHADQCGDDPSCTAFWAWGTAGTVVAVPILVTFRVLCSHIEALAPIGEFLSQRQAAQANGGEPRYVPPT